MPVGFRIASAWVDIRAEDKGLRQQIKDAVEKAAKGQEAKIQLKIDSKGLRREVENALKEATKGQKPKVEIGIKSTGLRREVSDALKKATEKQKPTVKLGINSAGLRGEVQRALTAATKDQKPTVRLGISSAGLRGEVQRALAEATAGQDGRVSVRVDVNRNALTRALADANPTIRPDVDVRHMRSTMMAAIRQINQNSNVTINPNIDGDAMRAQIRSEIGRLRDRFRVHIDPDVDTDTFAARIQAAARSVRSDIDIDLNPRINQLRLRAEAARIRPDIQFNGTLNTAMTRARLMASLRLAQAGAHITIPVRYDRKQLQAMFGTIESGFRAIEGPTGRWSKLIQAGALLALPAFALLDHAVRSTGASIAVAVPMVTMLVSAFAAAKIGMQGMGTAISGVFNADILTNHQLDVLDVTLKGLAPSALRFVNQLKNLRGEFGGLRTAVQQILFSNLDSSLSQFAKQTLPVLKLGLAGTADQLNRMAQNTVSVINTSARTGELTAAFGAVQLAMEPLVPMPGQILNALTKMTIAAGPLLIRMTDSFGGWSKHMTEKLNQAFASGSLQAAISKAGDTIVNFFRRIANNPEFRTFLDRMKSNGPAIAKTFGDIANALMKVVNALSPISGVVMKVVDAFAKFIDAIPTIFLEAFIIKLFIFKTALMVTGLIKSLVTSLGALKMALIALQGPTQMAAALGPRLAALGASGPAIRRMAVSLGIFAKVGLALAGLYFTFTLINAGADKLFGTQPPNVDKLTASLKEFNRTGKLSGEASRVFKASWSQSVDGMDKKFGGLQAAIKGIAHAGTWDHVFNGFQKATNWLDPGKTKLEKYHEALDGTDKALAKMVKGGNMADANKTFAVLALQANKAGTSTKKFKTLLPGYTKALKEAKEAQKVAAETMGVFGKKALEVSGRLQQLKSDTDGLVKSLFALNNTQRDANQAERDMEQAATAMVEATKKKAIGLHYTNGVLIQTTKAQQDAAASMEDFAGKTEKSALATYAATGNWQIASKVLNENKAAIIKQAQAAGMGATEAKLYADSILKIPSKKEINIMVAGQAQLQLQDVAAAFRATPDKKVINVQTLNTAAIKGLEDLGYKVKQLPDGSFQVTAKTAPAESALEKIEKYKIDPKTVEFLAKITSLTLDIDKAQAKVDALKQKRKVAVGAEKTKLDKEVKAAQKKLDDLKQKRAAEIKAHDGTGPGVASAKKSLGSVKDKTVKITSIFTDLASGPAASAAAALRKQAENLSKKKATGGIIHRASGGGVPGYVSGPGGPMSDKIAAMLSNGEFVMRASAVDKFGVGFMNSVNQGKFPKFAVGGAVAGAGGASGTSGVRSGTTTGTFTVKDATGKPVASAVQNFKALSAALTATYSAMQQKTNQFGSTFTLRSNSAYKAVNAATGAFGRTQVSRLNVARSQSQGVWSGWKAGMESRTSSAYKNLGTQASNFNRSALSTTGKTRSGAHSIWSNWKSGMESRTNSAYGNINKATSSFQKQSVSAMGKARDGMGSAWGGLSPKFKPPVSYLVHTVINQGVVGSINAIMDKLGGGKKVGGIGVAGFAGGGAIYGAGTKTSDSIPARLSNGEFVMQAKAVDKFGTGFMNSLNQGKMPHDGAGFSMGGGVNITMPGFASGGSVPSADTLNKIMGDGGDANAKQMTDFIMSNYVLPLIDSGSGGSAMKEVQRAGMNHIRANVEKFVKENFGGAGSASAGLRWAKTQYGKPYQWGGNGNPSWDCSGFMSAIESVIRGEKPHRRWATGSFSGATAPSGWKLNANAPFKIGVTNAGVGHTAGTIGKENVESSGGVGVHGGASARGWNNGMFPSHYGYVGPNATKKASGGHISGPGGPRSDKIAAWLSNGEYVIQAAAVKRLGLDNLNLLNAGVMPGFASGGYTKTKGTGKNKRYYYNGKWYTLDGYRKAKSAHDKAAAAATATATAEKEGRSNLTKDVTFSHFGQMAEAQGSFKHNEMENYLGKPADIASLVDSLNGVAAMIKASFHGSTETSLLKKLDSSGKALLANQKKLDGVNAALDKAKENLTNLQDSFNSLRDSVKGNITDFANITKAGKYGTSGSTLLSQLQKDVDKAGAFSGQLNQLKAKGVDPALIQQIAEAGITGGGAATAATVLSMSPEQLAQLNSMQKQLTDFATAAGNTTADAMYGAGLRAAEGLVKGLTAQQQAIEDVMMAIAKSMEAAIKKALGIKSPSRVMMKVADFTADGLQNQLLARTAGISETMRTMVTVPNAPSTAPASPGITTGTISTGSRGSVTNIGVINVNVSGTFALNSAADRRALAKTIAKDVKEEIRKDDKAHR